MKFEPLEYGKGFIFEDRIKSGAIPKEFIKPVELGVIDAMQSGELAGYPVIDVKAILLDGSYHEVDSSDLAFRIAASKAFREAMLKSSPILMEPVMEVSGYPEESMGDVIGDLSSRRGKILKMDARNKIANIKSEVPLSNMFGYATDLRSKTKVNYFTMQFKNMSLYLKMLQMR